MDKKKKNLQYVQVIHHQIILQVVFLFYFQNNMVGLMVYYLLMDERWIVSHHFCGYLHFYGMSILVLGSLDLTDIYLVARLTHPRPHFTISKSGFLS